MHPLLNIPLQFVVADRPLIFKNHGTIILSGEQTPSINQKNSHFTSHANNINFQVYDLSSFQVLWIQ